MEKPPGLYEYILIYKDIISKEDGQKGAILLVKWGFLWYKYE